MSHTRHRRERRAGTGGGAARGGAGAVVGGARRRGRDGGSYLHTLRDAPAADRRRDRPGRVIAAVVLAAGEGRRFGGLKQLHEVDGRPMLERVLGTLATAGLEHRVVVLGARAGTILERVDLQGARPVGCDRWDAGQAASLHAGLDALPDEAEWALVVLGDGPGLEPRAVERVLAAAVPGDD